MRCGADLAALGFLASAQLADMRRGLRDAAHARRCQRAFIDAMRADITPQHGHAIWRLYTLAAIPIALF